jgi:Tol biopolymer transport system component
LNAYYGVSLTANSHLLTTHQATWSSDIWLLDLAEPEGARPITTGGRSSGPVWTPDRKILYISAETRMRNFWIMGPDGNESRSVTDNKEGIRDDAPHVPPNGRYIVFRSDRTGSFHLWREDLDGNNPKQLSDATNEFVSGLDVSPDGKWIVYSRIDRNGGLWKMPIDGGSPIRLSSGYADFPVVSPDGKSIAYFYGDPKARYGCKVAIMPFEGGPPTKLFDIPSDLYRWTPDGRSLLYVEDEGYVSNFWSQAIAGGPPKQITHFSNGSGGIGSFDLSKDGKQLVMERTLTSNHVVLIRDLK